MSSRCPPTHHGSKKRSPNIATVILDSVDTDKGGCDSRGVGAFLGNQISSLFEQWELSWNRDVRQSWINASKSKICQIWDFRTEWALTAKLSPSQSRIIPMWKNGKSWRFVPDRQTVGRRRKVPCKANNLCFILLLPFCVVQERICFTMLKLLIMKLDCPAAWVLCGLKGLVWAFWSGLVWGT